MIAIQICKKFHVKIEINGILITGIARQCGHFVEPNTSGLPTWKGRCYPCSVAADAE